MALASKADAVLYVGGLSPEWESEGFDRPCLQLPGLQDELITRLGEANAKTIVCIQAVSRTTYSNRVIQLNCVKGFRRVDALGKYYGRYFTSLVFR